MKSGLCSLHGWLRKELRAAPDWEQVHHREGTQKLFHGVFWPDPSSAHYQEPSKQWDREGNYALLVTKLPRAEFETLILPRARRGATYFALALAPMKTMVIRSVAAPL